MAHNLNYANSRYSMAYNRQNGNPWHELGTPVDGAMTAAQALKLSQQDWEVIKRQLFTHNTIGDEVLIPAWGIFRDDNGQFLGVCGEDYTPIQNVEQFNSIDFLLENSPEAKYETAGVLGRGERVWTLARIPEADIVVAGKDKHQSYLLACTSHDGSLAFTLKLSSVRVVCNNTLNMALASNGAIARIKHTKNALERVEASKRYMRMVADNAKSLQEKLNILASRKMTRESYTAVMDKLFPVSRDEKGEQTNQGRRQNILSDIIRLYESNDRNTVPEIKGTAYNLLNAVVEYTDHLRTARVSDDKSELGYTPSKARAESALFGSGESLKVKALDVILTDTKGNPVQSATKQYYDQGSSNGLLDAVIASHPSA